MVDFYTATDTAGLPAVPILRNLVVVAITCSDYVHTHTHIHAFLYIFALSLSLSLSLSLFFFLSFFLEGSRDALPNPLGHCHALAEAAPDMYEYIHE